METDSIFKFSAGRLCISRCNCSHKSNRGECNLALYFNLNIETLYFRIWRISNQVIKTRLQLQGELAKRGTYIEKYNGTVHGFIQVKINLRKSESLYSFSDYSYS